jgi:hypothetical protein
VLMARPCQTITWRVPREAVGEGCIDEPNLLLLVFVLVLDKEVEGRCCGANFDSITLTVTLPTGCRRSPSSRTEDSAWSRASPSSMGKR